MILNIFCGTCSSIVLDTGMFIHFKWCYMMLPQILEDSRIRMTNEDLTLIPYYWAIPHPRLVTCLFCLSKFFQHTVLASGCIYSGSELLLSFWWLKYINITVHCITLYDTDIFRVAVWSCHRCCVHVLVTLLSSSDVCHPNVAESDKRLKRPVGVSTSWIVLSTPPSTQLSAKWSSDVIGLREATCTRRGGTKHGQLHVAPGLTDLISRRSSGTQEKRGWFAELNPEIPICCLTNLAIWAGESWFIILLTMVVGDQSHRMVGQPLVTSIIAGILPTIFV